jgi:hypothetical protein
MDQVFDNANLMEKQETAGFRYFNSSVKGPIQAVFLRKIVFGKW